VAVIEVFSISGHSIRPAQKDPSVGKGTRHFLFSSPILENNPEKLPLKVEKAKGRLEVIEPVLMGVFIGKPGLGTSLPAGCHLIPVGENQVFPSWLDFMKKSSKDFDVSFSEFFIHHQKGNGCPSSLPGYRIKNGGSFFLRGLKNRRKDP